VCVHLVAVRGGLELRQAVRHWRADGDLAVIVDRQFTLSSTVGQAAGLDE